MAADGRRATGRSLQARHRNRAIGHIVEHAGSARTVRGIARRGLLLGRQFVEHVIRISLPRAVLLVHKRHNPGHCGG